MRSRQNVLIGLLVVLALAVMVGSACAVTVSDPNLLSGMPAAGSTEDVTEPLAPWSPLYVTDGKAVVTGGVYADWVTASTEPWPRLAIWGFNASIDTIRIWGAGDLDPDQVAIKSSTSLITQTTGTLAAQWPATVGDAYGTTLSAMAAMPTRITDGMAGDQPWQMYYWDISVSAPAGTQSLYFDFGTSGRTRIVEVQAFGIVTPEPGTLALLITGLIGLLAYAWRKRR